MPLWGDIPRKLIPVGNSSQRIEIKEKEMGLMLFLQPPSKIYFQPSDRYWEETDLLTLNYDNILLLGDFKAALDKNFIISY